jgi:hypothetical protein
VSGVDISLVRFQPYRTTDGQVFVTFSRLFPLPDLEKSLVAPGTPVADVSTEKLPVIEWTTADLVALGRVANPTTRTTLDLCAERSGDAVSLTEIVDAAGITRSAARGQLAGLTMVMKRRFGRRNWPFVIKWNVDGSTVQRMLERRFLAISSPGRIYQVRLCIPHQVQTAMPLACPQLFTPPPGSLVIVTSRTVSRQ